jgi:hypothetical protein
VIFRLLLLASTKPDITNALCSVTGQNILGAKADELCQQGITDSAQYLKLALKDLDDWKAIKSVGVLSDSSFNFHFVLDKSLRGLGLLLR